MSDCDIGLVGLGTMGSALALNIAEKGFSVAVWNRSDGVAEEFAANAGELGERITPAKTYNELVAALRRPRAIILMVPAGDTVDQQIAALRPLLDPEDLIIDAGNANFHDTNRRMRDGSGPFLGVGVSGGEDGARIGPSMMGGGPRKYWERVAPIFTAIAAKFKGEPCAALLGEEGSGHFVKAVHNGIEYADMQLIAESYGLMRDGLDMSAPEIGSVFTDWNKGPLESYLIEISGKVACAEDMSTGKPLLDVILDAAGQKGTGRWTAIEAQHLGAPIPTIEAAVAARNMSAQRDLRAKLQADFDGSGSTLTRNDLPLETLERALICGKVLCYTQGFDMIRAASEKFDWSLDSPQIARVWRAGCIIRSAMLDDMAVALAANSGETLMAAPHFADILRDTVGSLREVVIAGSRAGLPVPALSAALGYFDTMRMARGTANMIQGQRDFFGLHGFVRMDTGKTDQHGPWADT